MNLLLLEPADFVGEGRARVAGRRLEHVREILRSAPGDRLRVGALGGLCGEGTVLAVGPEALELEVRLDTPPPPPLALSLVLALPRPPSLRRVLQAAAAMGVKEIDLVHSARVEKSYWQSPLLAPAALEAELRLGLEQARDTALPRVRAHRSFRQYAERELPALRARGRVLLAHPEGARPCPHAEPGPLAVLVGPEGGWLEREVESLRAAGAEPVEIGPRPLRVDTAVVALLARLTP